MAITGPVNKEFLDSQLHEDVLSALIGQSPNFTQGALELFSQNELKKIVQE